MDSLAFSCPGCAVELSVPRQQAEGVVVLCPQCGQRLQLAAKRAATAPPPPLATPVASKAPPPIAVAPPVPTPPPEPEDEPAFDAFTPTPRETPPGAKKNPRPRKPSRVLLWGLAGGAGVLLLGLVAFIAVVAMAPDTRRKATSSTATTNVAKYVNASPDKTKRATPKKDNPPVKEPAKVEEPEKEQTPVFTGPPKFEDWPQDLQAAKRRAAKDNKDLLILFHGSDWCAQSQRLARQVLLTPTFRQRVAEHYVTVSIDFPKKKPAQAKVQDAARNERLKRQFDVDGYPTLVLADPEGRPFAATGYQEATPEEYCTHLSNLQEIRIRRDGLLTTFTEARGAARLEAARSAMLFLWTAEAKAGEGIDMLSAYGPLLRDWAKLAGQHDPTNENGDAELFFFAEWFVELRRAARAEPKDPKELDACVDRLDQWRKRNTVKDADRVAKLYLKAGELLSFAGDAARAARCFKEGLACRPSDPALAEQLAQSAAGKRVLGSGTGFVVADGGYILTNHHVAGGPGRLLVQLTKDGRASGDPIAAKLIAQDEQRDMALLQVPLLEGVRPTPLGLTANKEPRRGDRVFAFGYPLVQQLGSGIKMTDGLVTSLPDKEAGDMILTSAKVNPGNSGGPLCDASAKVIGMVTAKSANGPDVDSFGLALPSRDLEAFLKKHLKEYKASEGEAKEMRPDQVDQQVSPAVVRVLKVL